MHHLQLSVPISLACVTALALAAGATTPPSPASSSSTPGAAPAAAQRADSPPPRDPRALPALLARYDRLPAGAERERLARTIDHHAGQRYATVSRLYWYTELDAAKAAARATGRPILALRMLGRLDQDLSCANSRLFRAILYANATVSRLLRDRFVLYWSSERTVPRVTIDYGDGRTIEGTTTGNSAHYVLDDTGAVLDVLPGLYAPKAFIAELTKSLALATRVRGLGTTSARRQAVAAYHRDAATQADQAWARVAGAAYLPDRRSLVTQAEVDSALQRAQRATFAKAYIEVPQLRSITAGTRPGTIADDDAAQWAAAAQHVWRLGNPPRIAAPPAPHVYQPAAAVVRATRPTITLFDDPSVALMTQLHTARGVAATPAQLATVLARLEHHAAADSALNEFKLRPQIHRYLADQSGASLDVVNTWIYASVFHTPSDDPWLGLMPRVDFTGLPGDGATHPRAQGAVAHAP